MDYEQELAKLTPERKIELWEKHKNSTLSKTSKLRAIYYEARSLKYL